MSETHGSDTVFSGARATMGKAGSQNEAYCRRIRVVGGNNPTFLFDIIRASEERKTDAPPETRRGVDSPPHLPVKLALRRVSREGLESCSASVRKASKHVFTAIKRQAASAGQM